MTTIKFTKTSHYNSLLEQHKNNMKSNWNVIKEVIELQAKSTLSKTFTTANDVELGLANRPSSPELTP